MEYTLQLTDEIALQKEDVYKRQVLPLTITSAKVIL